MLTDLQKSAARKCLAERPSVIHGTRVVRDERARRVWYDQVNKAMETHGVNDMRDVSDFCDIAGVPC